MSTENPGGSSLPSHVKEIFTPLVSSISRAQSSLGHEFRLHLLYERIIIPSSSSISPTSCSTQTCVLFSPTIQFTDSNRKEAEQLIYSLTLFATVNSSNRSPHPTPANASSLNTVPLPAPTAGNTTTGDGQDMSYIMATDRILRRRAFVWFPAKPRVEGDKVLRVSTSIIEKFLTIRIETLRALYQDFFLRLYTLIKSSDYAAQLHSEGWSGYFRYKDFTAPWLLKQISSGNDIIYLNKMDAVELPSNKCLRNKLGGTRAARIFAAFHEQEQLCAPILNDMCKILNIQLVPRTTDQTPARDSATPLSELRAHNSSSTNGDQVMSGNPSQEASAPQPPTSPQQ